MVISVVFGALHLYNVLINRIVIIGGNFMDKTKLSIFFAILICIGIPFLITMNKSDASVGLPQTLEASDNVPKEELPNTHKLQELRNKLSREEMPTMAEIRELYYVSKEEYLWLLEGVGDLISNTPSEDIYKIIESSIESTLNSQTELDVDHFTVDFSKDNLSMAVPQNKKIYNNVMISINIYYDINKFKGDFVKEKTITEELSEVIMNSFDENTFIWYKLNSAEFNFFSTDNFQRSSSVISKGYKNGMNVKQSQEEQNIQTLAYDFVLDLSASPIYHSSFKRPRHNHDVVLTKFGIIEDNKELYAEILIYDIRSREDLETVLRDFQGIGQSLFNIFIEDKEALNYLKSNNVSKVTISFDVPWHDGRNKTYHYNIN